MATSQKSIASPCSTFSFRIAALTAITIALLVPPLRAQLAGDELFTRTFKVNPAQLQQISEPPVTNDESKIPVLRTLDPTTSLEKRLQLLFSIHGVTFANAALSDSARPNEKSMFFNNRTGQLIVRATLSDMNNIEAALAIVSHPTPPLVSIEVKLVEFDAAADEPPAFLKCYSSNLMNVSILTEPQFRVALSQLETAKGVDVVTPPLVMTISGRQVRVSAGESRQPLIYDTPPPLPKDTSPDADPTPRNKGRLPFPPTFFPGEASPYGAIKR